MRVTGPWRLPSNDCSATEPVHLKIVCVSTDYDAVAKEYKRSKLAPWRTYIERYSLLKLLGEVRGKSVLDLACGEGFYSRLVRARGAARVVGVDLSSGMIGLAIAAEKESPLGIEYRVGDAMAYQTDGRFDYRCRSLPFQLRRHRREACRDVPNRGPIPEAGRPFCDGEQQSIPVAGSLPGHAEVGFVKSVRGELQPDTTITYTIFQDGGSFNFDNYYLSPAGHERALEAAGLRAIEWLGPKLSPKWDGPTDYWDDFLDDPPVIFLQCRK